MESQFLVESAYMLPSNGAFIKKKVPPDTENTENNQYMEEVKTQYGKLHSAYAVFVDDEGIRELTQSNQLSRHDQYWIDMISVVTNTLWAVLNATKFWDTRKKFEINLKVYIQTRSQLQEETQALQNLGQILLDVGYGAKEILSDLMLHKFDQIADTVIATGMAVNALTQ